MDDRIEKLADVLTTHSVNIKPGDYVQLMYGVAAKDLALAVYRRILRKGATPVVDVIVPGFERAFYEESSDAVLNTVPLREDITSKVDASIRLIAPENTSDLQSIEPSKIADRRKVIFPFKERIIKKRNWVLFYYPTLALAQDAGMSLDEFEDFVFDSCLVDWEAESKKQLKLKKVLDEGSNVEIIGKNTHLKFSIANRQGIRCFGERNMPDGEVFIAPVEDSTEGFVEYDFPTIYAGREVDGIKLLFKDGKVVESSASKNEKFLKEMIAMDAGSCKLGEFGIGTNYQIQRHVKQILFDEKIGGTVHLALGMAYKEGNGRNESALHWDMIKDLKDGGKIIIDGKVISENGVFNPEYFG